MENIETIQLILKYFTFEQLCIAERIDSNFQLCVLSSFRALKYINFDKFFTNISNYDQIFNKIYTYCHNLKKVDGFEKFVEYLNSTQSARVIDIQRKLTSLNFYADGMTDPLTFDSTLDLIYNIPNLRQLELSFNMEKYLLNAERIKWIKDLLVGRTLLSKLCISYPFILRTNIPSTLSNLTCLSINLNYRMLYPAECQELYKLFDASPNIENLKISSIRADGKLIMELAKLKILKKLILKVGYPPEEDSSDFDYQSESSSFNNLLELTVYCGNTRRECKFVSTLLSMSPSLKRCNFSASGDVDQRFYNNIFVSIASPQDVECFDVQDNDYNSKLYCDLLTGLPNLKHYHVDQYLDIDGAWKIAKQKRWMFLQFRFKWPDDYNVVKLQILCSTSLVGVDLFFSYRKHDSINAIECFDVVLKQCPNLQYLSTYCLPIKRMCRLPFKMPGLQFLEIDSFIDEYGYIIYDEKRINGELFQMIEKLPKLRVLIVPKDQYRFFRELPSLQRLCRLGRLTIAHDRCSPKWKDSLKAKWLEICSGSCCSSRSFYC